ncbi:MAG: hypothetical protein HFJ09_06710 [Lachnospiraceae bacterium]|nr:hypothetical protein [Lachnospiraceae bacterium]
MIDISKVLREARLDYIEGYESDFILRGNTDELSQNNYHVYVSRESVVVEQESQEFENILLKKGNRVLSDIDIQSLDGYKYEDTELPVSCYWVNNPFKAGALGVQFDTGHRYFVSSGRLTGCGVAVLKREDKVYFIHAGASDSSSSSRNKDFITNDIYKAALALLYRNISDINTPMSYDELAHELNELQFSGVIFLSNSNKVIKNIGQIAIYSYEIFANVLLAINELGNCKVLGRWGKERFLHYESSIGFDLNISVDINLKKYTKGDINMAELEMGNDTKLADGKKNADTSKDDKSMADVLYEKITSVIGGDNPNQFFCMGLPGTLIEPSQYSYEVEKNQPKPAHVKANESKLVNKLFDACFMSSSDNGRHLQAQYRTALNMLTPKLNGKLFEAKTQLRRVLMTPYPYNFEDGNKEVLTLEQVFYRLYNDYVEAKREWAQKQIVKKNELAEKYPQETNEDYEKRDDEFLDWYGIVAEAEELVVEEKMGKVLSVFSPGDMEIITGILDSGVGREITEARNALTNVEEMNPNGGYIYPVTLYPENWFTLLDNSFTPIDLLESPAALSQQLSVLVMQRSNLTTNINKILAMIPEESAVNNLKDAYDKCTESFNMALDALQKENIHATVDMLKTLADVMTANSNKKASEVLESTAGRIFGVDVKDVKNILGKLDDSMTGCMDKQNKMVLAAQKATDAAVKYFQEKNQLQLKAMIEPLKQQLEDTNREIDELKGKIKLAATMQKEENKNTDSSAVAPNHTPDRFTQLIIESSMKQASNQSSMESSASSSSCGVSFFFGGYSSSSSHQEAVSSAFNESSDMNIQIGMSVAKVQIEREWFNPAVFLLSADMYNTSSEHISPAKDYTEFNNERLSEMNKCVFPCFPTSFVIARDVTIKFTNSKAMSSSFAKSVEEHSSRGGGFFIFGGSKSSSSSSSETNSCATSTADSVTVRFTSPQILGYYLEAIPADKSTSISSTTSASNADFISVFEFITAFQEMLDDHNKKYNEKTLNMMNNQ